MKRIFSLLLALTMLVSTLAVLSSCGGDKNPSSGNPSVRYVVTEEEWVDNMVQKNYTLNGLFLGTDKYTEENVTEYFCGKVNIKINDKALKNTQEIIYQGALEAYDFLQIKKDGSFFNVYKNVFNGKYEAVKVDEGQWFTVADIVYSYGVDRRMDSMFGEFTFDKDENCYVCEFADPNNISIKVWFADGVVTDIKLETDWEDEGYYSVVVYEFSFTDIGKTKIDIPAYTVVE